MLKTRIKYYLTHLFPGFFNGLSLRKDAKQLEAIKTISSNSENLSQLPENCKDLIFSEKANGSWDHVKKKREEFEFSLVNSGVNSGDRRAIFYLIDFFKPTKVLEIGTHVGASTIHIALALFGKDYQKDDKFLTTVDIHDVNDPKTKPWVSFGSKHSPVEMITNMGYGEAVDFVTMKSLDFLKSSNEKYDFIFLDGDHSATTVYQEVPAALELLNPGGVILLHDYFPDMESLWDNARIIRGPYLAVDRLIKEGADFKAIPLGALPWPTKRGSNVTSLALLSKSSRTN
jgi:predicted O-methyltransferase YrrM